MFEKEGMTAKLKSAKSLGLSICAISVMAVQGYYVFDLTEKVSKLKAENTKLVLAQQNATAMTQTQRQPTINQVRDLRNDPNEQMIAQIRNSQLPVAPQGQPGANPAQRGPNPAQPQIQPFPQPHLQASPNQPPQPVQQIAPVPPMQPPVQIQPVQQYQPQQYQPQQGQPQAQQQYQQQYQQPPQQQYQQAPQQQYQQPVGQAPAYAPVQGQIYQPQNIGSVQNGK